MAELITVEDPDDPRLGDYSGLTDVALRRCREPAEGLFMAEGEKVIRRAVRAGYGMRSMLLSAKWLEVMGDVIAQTPAPVYLVSPEVAERVTGYHVHRGALASMRRAPLPSPDTLLTHARGGVVTGSVDDHTHPGATSTSGPHTRERRIAIFEDIVDHANLGAAFRNAAALGVDAVLLTPRCVDPLYRRAVKVSMGAVFAVPYARFESWPRDADVVRKHGFVLAALSPSARSVTLDEFADRHYEKLALMLGTEGEGLSAEALRVADNHVRIPMDAGLDSLNVAASSAVAFYATRPRSG
ncbi:TrmH family RNA methyltransferase [Streptomyces oceani]|uniref:rRNA methyltransferase n=1 Tax=Streptomyces oceani TaxID=1075402 RepID=A0A1E7JYI3_9ACTN|nr:RNA methyltransferase [Streptomyces oceani]OEU96724.1 rRNA methyltransferase [Streptomyces oceani]